MQRLRKTENGWEKIHARVRKVILYGIGNFVWASGSEREVCGSHGKFSKREKEAER